MARLICIVVTRNRGTGSKSDGSSFLMRALDSYQKTIGCPSQLTVINDASTDDTRKLLQVRTNALNVHTIPRPPLDFIIRTFAGHKGIGGAMNAEVMPLLNEADIVVRFDDDILFNCPGWGQRILDTFANAPPEMVSLGGRQIDPRGWMICFGDRLIGPVYRHHFSQWHPDIMTAPPDKPDVLFKVHSVMGAFGAFRASALKAIGGYDPRFAKLRCETEDVHCEFLMRGWHAAVRFGLDITHWTDPTFEHAAVDKAWGCENLNEEWYVKWDFHRTGLNGKNGFDPYLAALRVKQITNLGGPLRRCLVDDDFDEVPGVVGAYTLCRLPDPMPPPAPPPLPRAPSEQPDPVPA